MTRTAGSIHCGRHRYAFVSSRDSQFRLDSGRLNKKTEWSKPESGRTATASLDLKPHIEAESRLGRLALSLVNGIDIQHTGIMLANIESSPKRFIFHIELLISLHRSKTPHMGRFQDRDTTCWTFHGNRNKSLMWVCQIWVSKLWFPDKEKHAKETRSAETGHIKSTTSLVSSRNVRKHVRYLARRTKSGLRKQKHSSLTEVSPRFAVSTVSGQAARFVRTRMTRLALWDTS